MSRKPRSPTNHQPLPGDVLAHDAESVPRDASGLPTEPSWSKPSTIRDVATAAGVAVSSVSRVLNNHPHVSDDLRARVETAARTLGYRPNYVAHSLRRGNTASVGFLVGTISNPIIANILSGVSEVLAESGFATLLVSSQNDPAADIDYVRFFAQRRVSGLIISSAANGPDDGLRALIVELGLPAIMLDRYPLHAPHVSAVYSDHARGVHAAMNHLIGQGHSRIALIGGADHFDPAAMRLAGYQRALQEAGLDADPALVRAWGMERKVGYAATLDLFGQASPPSALIAGGNLILAGVLQALHELGIVAGRDAALVGCDDTDLTRLHRPSISVITRDLEGMGRAAAATLLGAMEQGEAQTIVLPTRLEVRESSLYAPRAG